MENRTETLRSGFRLYQWLILGALAAAVIGAYGILIHLVVSRLHPPPPRREIVLAAPAEGTVVTAGGSVTIQAECRGTDVYRIELWVDSVPIQVAARSLPADDSPWNVEAEWTAGWPGVHHISARGLTPAGDMVSTTERTVLVVPDGEVLFVSNRDGPYALYRMRLDGTGIERVFAGLGDSREPAVNRFGQVVFVQRLAGQHHSLWTLDGSERHPRVWQEDMANLQQPAWSPDGQRLAYVSDREGADQIWTARADGTDARPLTTERSAAGQPTWSYDGAYVVYSVREDGNWDIIRTSTDGSGRIPLTSSPAVDWQPACSPVGDQIAFVSNRTGVFQIYVMDMAGGNLRQLTDFAGGAEQPRWSPDGSWLIFVGYAGQGEGLNGRELFIMRSDGRDVMRLTYNLADDTEPAWLSLAPVPGASSAETAPMELEASYFDNLTCAGEPRVRRQEALIDYDWGLGSPFPGVPADRFSVCWAGSVRFAQAGDYLLEVQADDAVRVWLDDVLIVDAWGRQGLQELRLPVHVPAGEEHLLRAAYYDLDGTARIRLRWRSAP